MSKPILRAVPARAIASRDEAFLHAVARGHAPPSSAGGLVE
jgi:hypothetical protein